MCDPNDASEHDSEYESEPESGSDSGSDSNTPPEFSYASFGTPTRESMFERIEDPAQQEEAMREILVFYERLIQRIADHLCPSQQDKLDVAQDACLNLAKGLPNFRYSKEKGRFRNYLRRVVRNAYIKILIDRKRRNKHEPNGFEDFEVEAMRPEYALARDEVEEAMRLAELDELIPIALSRFNSDYRKVYWAIMDSGKSVEEIARELDFTINNVHQIMSRVRKAIRELLRRLDQDSSEGPKKDSDSDESSTTTTDDSSTGAGAPVLA